MLDTIKELSPNVEIGRKRKNRPRQYATTNGENVSIYIRDWGNRVSSTIHIRKDAKIEAKRIEPTTSELKDPFVVIGVERPNPLKMFLTLKQAKDLKDQLEEILAD